MEIAFSDSGLFSGANGQDVLENPTSLQFGPDGRLYVTEQNGTINAFTIVLQNGEYAAIDHEVLTLANGAEAVKSMQNHNDDGSPNDAVTNRQVTGMVVAGTADNPVLYVSSSDPRISVNGEANLDTNSGVITQLTWTGTEWEAVDLVRGLPRSEENHSNNGMTLSPDGTKLYVTVGGNTNNGAPSQFFSYTGEYALSGTVLEIDLVDMNSRPVLTDPDGGQGGLSRSYVYDLPTLDDPNTPNVDGGGGEDAQGMDEAGPWGGRDGLNQAILPADAPLRIYADGFRNAYDLVFTANGNLYTVDNGSNAGLGGNPVVQNGQPTNQPNNGGTGDPEPLFLIQDGGYYGHPAPVRANQDLAWTVYDDNGNPDTSLAVNSVPDLSALVPNGVAIQDGFLIDPSKFSDDPARLAESGVRVERDSAQSTALVTVGSSSNGLVEYTGTAFGGALQGDLLVAQFNGNIGRLDLNADGTAATYSIIDGLGGLSTPLDVTVGPDGTVWVASLGSDDIKVFAPSGVTGPNTDADGDGLANAIDPFQRDASNGGDAVLFAGQTLLWDFDANQDGNLPGQDGFGGGLTGVMIDGTTDFEAFFQSPSTLPGQNIQLDNVKFITAAGGGTTVIESVSNGDPFAANNSGTFLFHTGATIAPSVETFTVEWTVFNPSSDWTGGFQQIGGYIGTGDQGSYLKIVAIEGLTNEIQVLLEDNDTVMTNATISAPGLIGADPGTKIVFSLEIDTVAETAAPTVTYETATGLNTVTGTPISLSGTEVLAAIGGQHSVAGQTTGVALGLLSSNTGQDASDTFQAVFDGIKVTAEASAGATVLYRLNTGGPTIAAIDGGPDWLTDTSGPGAAFLTAGGTGTASFAAVEPGPTFPPTTPGAIYDTERWDPLSGAEMSYDFATPVSGDYEVRLYVGNGFGGTSQPGERIYDIDIEGTTVTVDPTADFGHLNGGVVTTTVTVTDGNLDLDFIHGVENPLINGIEILQLGDGPPPAVTGSAVLGVTAGNSNVQISNFGANSFQITNTGDKQISQIEIDVTGALYADVVFDPFGVAGDTVSKPLTIDTAGGTGVVIPADPYVGAGGTAGYKGLVLTFDPGTDGGFESGETVGFSVDMDPNSIAGADKGPLDAGTNPPWDVGGVSGAELIGSTFTVTYADGTTSTGQLMGDGSQAGAEALSTQATAAAPVSLTVNGATPGQTGTYASDDFSVIVDGPAGETVRVILSKGIIQPTTNTFYNGTPAQQAYAPQLDAQLDALAASDFPANNAAEFQTVDIVLTGAPQDISGLFDISDIAGLTFAGEDEVPLALVAATVDPANGGLATGLVGAPIYLTFADTPPANTAPVAADDGVQTTGGAVLIDVLANDSDADGDQLTITAVGQPTNGTAVIQGNAILYTPSGQAAPVIDTGFAGGPSGFTYADDIFRGTSQPGFASGASGGTLGQTGGGLSVTLGGINGQDITDGMSGGWSTDFTLATAGAATLEFSYRLDMAPSYENNEFSDVLVAVDGALQGLGGNDYVARIAGGGDTDWVTVSLDLGTLAAGTHTLALGGFNNQKTTASEVTVISFDDVTLDIAGAGGPGADSFSYTIVDGNGGSDTAQVTVTPAAQTLVANEDTASTTLGTPVAIPVLANDSGGTGTLSIIAVTTPANGTAVIQGDTILYTPDATSVLVDEIDAAFDADADQFVFVDDSFRNTDHPGLASGSYEATGGLTGGGLEVVLGGQDNADITDGMSGGWERSFTLAEDGAASLTFSYELETAPQYENDEFSDILISLDGELLGLNGNDYITRIAGGGQTGWQTVTLDLGLLSAGDHTVTFGAFNNKKTFADEITTARFDDILLSVSQTDGFTGQDDFEYTVTDSAGQMDTAQVMIDVDLFMF